MALPLMSRANFPVIKLIFNDLHRDFQHETAALARLALDIQACLVSCQHVFDDCQAEPGAAGFP